ncbi:MAG TPA: hypothetical protein P5137_11015, partial [Candidatus Brocadiia bacterium]|nr:hypothetical protein [Candidatus Brocadiia bacterium]
ERLMMRRKDAAGGLVVKGLLPNVEYEVTGNARGFDWSVVAERQKWSFNAADEAPRIVLKGRKAAARGVERPMPPRQPLEEKYESDMKALAASAWQAKDPVQTNLVWFGEDLAVADTDKKTVQRFPGFFGHKTVKAIGIGFGQERVWVGTDKGMFVWDRKGRYWNRFAVGGEHFEAPVTSFKTEGDAWQVTVRLADGKEATFVFDAKTGTWVK